MKNQLLQKKLGLGKVTLQNLTDQEQKNILGAACNTTSGSNCTNRSSECLACSGPTCSACVCDGDYTCK